MRDGEKSRVPFGSHEEVKEVSLGIDSPKEFLWFQNRCDFNMSLLLKEGMEAPKDTISYKQNPFFFFLKINAHLLVKRLFIHPCKVFLSPHINICVYLIRTINQEIHFSGEKFTSWINKIMLKFVNNMYCFCNKKYNKMQLIFKITHKRSNQATGTKSFFFSLSQLHFGQNNSLLNFQRHLSTLFGCICDTTRLKTKSDSIANDKDPVYQLNFLNLSLTHYICKQLSKLTKLPAFMHN
eukprot:bmy_02355T0